MLLRAFAKINLDLRILGRRHDGYHEVRTIFQAIDWWDEIVLEPAAHFEFSSPGTPEDETNLIVRAVRAYERLAGITANVRIGVMKNIPNGRGLGGCSAACDTAWEPAGWTNDVEGPVFQLYPELSAIKDEFLALGAYRSALSGSGSSISGQFQMVSDAVRSASIMGRHFGVKVTKPLP